jgi:hypothetical protein
MLLAKSHGAAAELRELLNERSINEGGSLKHWAIAKDGLRVSHPSVRAAGI